MCPVCSIKVKLPDRPDLPEMELAVDPGVTQHEVPADILEHKVLLVFRNGQLMQPGEHNDYVLNRAEGFVRWNVPLAQDEQACFLNPLTGARWAWSPQCGVFVHIQKAAQ